MRNDPAIRTARACHKPEPLGWKLVEPIAFVDSRDHPAIQLADVVAGTAAALFTHGLPGCDAIVDSVSRHGHRPYNPAGYGCNLPGKPDCRCERPHDLAKRAERGGDPCENLEAMYHFAEVSWARGDYNLVKAGAQPRR